MKKIVGVVYFIRSGKSGPIKIGKTSGAVAERLRSLQTGNPETLEVLAVIPDDGFVEDRMHRRFAHAHYRGEWFRPEDDLLHFIDGAAAAGLDLEKIIAAERAAAVEKEAGAILAGIARTNFAFRDEIGAELILLARAQEREETICEINEAQRSSAASALEAFLHLAEKYQPPFDENILECSPIRTTEEPVAA